MIDYFVKKKSKYTYIQTCEIQISKGPLETSYVISVIMIIIFLLGLWITFRWVTGAYTAFELFNQCIN